MGQFIVTIARQYGSGGKTIGRMLAERLAIPCYDREIITMASEDSGVNERLFSDEQLKQGFWKQLAHRYHDTIPVSPEHAKYIEADNLYRFQAKIIRRLAEQGPCVLIGRCADNILRDRNDVARVLVHAPLDFRLRQAAKVNSLPEAALRQKIEQTDEYRAAFYRYYTGNEWLNADNFDLTLNSGVLGFDGTADAMEAYLTIRGRAQR